MKTKEEQVQGQLKPTFNNNKSKNIKKKILKPIAMYSLFTNPHKLTLWEDDASAWCEGIPLPPSREPWEELLDFLVALEVWRLSLLLILIFTGDVDPELAAAILLCFFSNSRSFIKHLINGMPKTRPEDVPSGANEKITVYKTRKKLKF